MSQDRPTLDRPVDAPPAEAVPEAEQRLAWLFRDSLRQRLIHPLLAVVRRYRERAVQ
jgi:hypothetical protein